MLGSGVWPSARLPWTPGPRCLSAKVNSACSRSRSPDHLEPEFQTQTYVCLVIVGDSVLSKELRFTQSMKTWPKDLHSWDSLIHQHILWWAFPPLKMLPRDDTKDVDQTLTSPGLKAQHPCHKKAGCLHFSSILPFQTIITHLPNHHKITTKSA